MATDANALISSLPVDQNTKADLWDAATSSKNPAELSSKLMPMKVSNDIKAKLWDWKSSQQAPSGAGGGWEPQSTAEKYGLTLENVGQNVIQFGKGTAGVAKDLLDPRVPIFQGQNSLANKYVINPMQQQAQRAQQEISEGGSMKIAGRTNAALSGIPILGPTIGAIGEQAGRGDIGGAATQAALTAITSKAGPKDLPEGASEGTIGMAKGGAAAEVERLAGRMPVVTAPLKAKYAAVADSFKSTVADAVTKATGVKSNPADLVGTLGDGVKQLDANAKGLYKPVDEYVAKNATGMVSKLVETMSADPEKLRELPQGTYENPISGLKQFRTKLELKGDSLQRGGKGSEAFDYFQQARNVQQVLDSVTSQLPPEIKATYDKAQATYGKARAMEDIQEVFGKQASGLPPAQQSAATFKRPVGYEGKAMVKELSGQQARLSQAFDPETSQAIIQHADKMGVAQSISGSKAGNIGGMLMGTGMLVQAFRGNIAMLGPELGGMWLLSKVLATPEAIPLYRNMLRSGSLAEEQAWAKQAVDKATGQKGPGE